MIVKELIQTAAWARDVMDAPTRRETVRFVRSKWNRDGGAQGKDVESDLYYTVFAAMCMRALKGNIPLLRLWGYLRSFGDGRSLDLLRLFSLIRLRSIYPMRTSTRDALMESLEKQNANSATDMFFKVIMAQYLHVDDRPEADLSIRLNDSTPEVAAAVVVNQRPDPAAERILMRRYEQTGGFNPTPTINIPTLEATATALYALRVLGAKVDPIRAPCLAFIASLRRDGGYVSDQLDLIPDVESTFYAIFSIGCLTAPASADDQ